MKSLYIILILFLGLNFCYSQTDYKINFYGNQKTIKTTKSILEKNEISLILNDNEIKLELTDSLYFRMPDLTSKQIKHLENKEYIILKFERKNQCYLSLFKNYFRNSKSFNHFYITKTKKIIKILGFINFKFKTKELQTIIQIHNTSKMTPLRMINCKHYKGEFDHGLDDYLNNRKTKTNLGPN